MEHEMGEKYWLESRIHKPLVQSQSTLYWRMISIVKLPPSKALYKISRY